MVKILKVDQQARGVLDRFLDADEESHRFPAVDQAMIVAERQVHHRTRDDLALDDHRLIDGREAVTFLVRVKEAIEDPTRLLIDL